MIAPSRGPPPSRSLLPSRIRSLLASWSPNPHRHPPKRLRGHQRFHQQQCWSDIAYHFGVDRRGNLYELRTPEWAGDTFTEYDPAGHFLVVCEGDDDREHPTDAMLQATAEILAHGAQVHGADAQAQLAAIESG